MDRRAFVRGAAWAGAAWWAGSSALVERLAAQGCLGPPLGELLELVPLHGERARVTPFAQMLGGRGLDARRFTDLSHVAPDRLITPSEEVFVRTTAPEALASETRRWPLPLATIERNARDLGTHLIECSGNVDPDNFGLMSAADWRGVPLADVVSTLPPRSGAHAVLVGGLDDPPPSRSSAAGASWIFPLETLAHTGAFLAVGMNGARLTPDHGAPLRLVVPGWYGCSWIKWVNELRLVGDDEPVTPQMIEFSLRTHQTRVPRLARDYEAPTIDLAATAIRVEKRRVDGRLEYRIVGIVWGGERPVDRLAIRFRAGDRPEAFALCPVPRTHRTWSLWDYRWRPPAPGVYSIALSAVDPAIRTRRLDVSFYVRRVVIDEVQSS